MIIAVLAICTLLSLRKSQQVCPTGQEAFGRYTARQMFDATTPICRELLPGADGLQLMAEPHSTYAIDETIRHLWEVDCLDSKREAVAHFWWDAETGILDRFACSAPYVRAGPLPHLASAAAVEHARHGMDLLGWGPGAQWQVCQPPKLAARGWIILLGNKNRRIRTWVDAESGILVAAMQETAH
jgi:hypothetical protein